MIDRDAEAAKARPTSGPLKLHVFMWGAWPEDLSLRREDMYGDWGR